METKKNKLQAKDLINVGIYTALYFVIQFILGLSGFIPVMMLVMPFIASFIGSIVLMLYFTKVKRFGMVTITGILLGIVVFLTGRAWQAVAICVLGGLLGDIVMKIAKYSKTGAAVIACGFVDLWQSGMSLPLFFGFRDAYLASLVEGYGQEYVDTLASLTPDWLFFVMTAGIFVCGVLGGLFGKKVLKKHFEKAGMV